MFGLRRLLTYPITPDAFDRHVGQVVCFLTAPALLYYAVRAISRFASTPGEVVVGLLAAIVASLLFIVIGLLLPMAFQSPRPTRRCS